jgi:hypothetical protein
MRTKPGAALAAVVLAVATTVFWVAPVAAADADAAQVAQPAAQIYGKTLKEWLGIYWRWRYATGSDPAQSMVGRVKLLPLPSGKLITGAGTPEDPGLYRGILRITLPPGTPFVLPLAVWTAERYNDGTADDPAIPNADFLAGVSPSLYIGAKSVVSDENKRAFYVRPTPFDPIVVYPEPTSYNSYAAIGFQGYGIVSRPLPLGRHVIHLYEPYIVNSVGFSFGVIYDNTWIVTVKAR